MSVAHDFRDTAALAPTALGRPKLMTVDDAKRLEPKSVADLVTTHMNPGVLHFMKLLGFHNVIVERAEGPYYYARDGRKILDFFGGFGSLAFGHNHPRILEARRKFQEEKRHDIGMAFLSQYASTLAFNLAAVSPGALDYVFLASTGSEAMEAAIKIAEQAQGPKRSKIVYAEHSFHGKTKGALSLTDSRLYRSQFRLVENGVKVPFGDLHVLEEAIKADPEIGVVVLETIQGGAGIVEAPASYWQGVRALCDRHGVLWVADEVQCGMGRSGRFYAFEHTGVAPDVTALAKSLGGGKSAVGAMIARPEVFKRAYGSRQTALVHGPSTFGGMGEACITAIEGLNILYDENLIENAETVGAHLKARLQAIQEKYPRLVKEVRGRGLMLGIELQDFSSTLPFGIRQLVATLDEKLKGSLAGFLGNLLLRDYNILVAFTEYNRNVIRLEPPLVITRAHADEFADALDDLLSRGVVKIVTDFLKAQRSG